MNGLRSDIYTYIVTYIDIMEYYLSVTKNEIMTLGSNMDGLEIVILSVVSQRKTNIISMLVEGMGVNHPQEGSERDRLHGNKISITM